MHEALFPHVAGVRAANGGGDSSSSQARLPGEQKATWKWSPQFEMAVARLALFLQNLEDIPTVCEMAASILCPEKDISNIESSLPGAFEIHHAFNVFVLGEETMNRL